MKRSNKYKKAKKESEKKSKYELSEALEILPEISTSNFVGSAELHINLNMQKDKSIKGSVKFPNEIKSNETKIAVVTTPDNYDEAKKAGADFVDGDKLIKKIEEGWSEFDILIATPNVMPKIAKLGRTLGPKGLMPNPKNNTVTENLKKVITAYKSGKVDFKAGDHGGIHQSIGKISQETEKLVENAYTFIEAVFKEANILGPTPFKSIYVAPSMGPSLEIDRSELMKKLTE